MPFFYLRPLSALAAAVGLAASVSADPPHTVPFQAVLKTAGGTLITNSAQPVVYSLYTVPSGGTAVYTEAQAVAVTKGQLSTVIGITNAAAFAALPFNVPYYVGIKVGNDAEMTPRIPLAAVPYANYAAGVAPTVLNGIGWLLGGNSGTSPSTQFLGTTDNQPLVLKTNGRQTMRYVFADDPAHSVRSMNVIGGSEINSATGLGDTIAGGGQDGYAGADYPNTVTDNFGSIGGGAGNSAYALATVAGGGVNNASGLYSAIGGGGGNTAGNEYAVISGGYTNTASGVYSAVPGGAANTAAGFASFAAGAYAQANHDGTFVWNDGTTSYFTSTGPDQFLVRASGGVGINKNNPVAGSLDVAGNALFSGNVGIGTTSPGFPLNFPNTLGEKIALYGSSGPNVGMGVQGYLFQIHSDLPASDIAFGYGSSAAMTETMRIKGNGNVGIGTPVPGFPLNFANVLGEKVSFYGNSGPNDGIGIQNNLLQIHTDFPQVDIGFGYGSSTAFTESARITGGGDVKAVGDVYARGVKLTSDGRFKTNVATYDNALDTLLNLRGVTFDWNREAWKEKNFPEGRQVGFIAQEVEQVLPELVSTDAGGYKSVAYQNVIPIAVEAIKAQQAQIAEKDARLNEQQAEIDALRRQNAATDARLKRLEAAITRNG